jgi:hypothetical protein
VETLGSRPGIDASGQPTEERPLCEIRQGTGEAEAYGLAASYWGIPTLDLSWQASTEDIRKATEKGGWLKWGSSARSGKGIGRAIYWYCWDQQFTAVIRFPDQPLRYGASVCVEANFSTYPSQPGWEALATIGRKRVLASHWGRAGIKLVVDLNVAAEFRDLSLLGVPFGWSAYATRAHRDTGPSGILGDYNLASDHAARGGVGPDRLLFIVFGGGQKVRELCQDSQWGWVPEQARMIRGTAAEPIPV